MLHQPSKTSMCTQIELVCTYIRGLTSKHHTLEVRNAFLHSKNWTNSLKQKNTSKMNIIAYIKRPSLQVQIDRVGFALINCIKGPTVDAKFDASSRYQNFLPFKLNSQFHTTKIPLFPFMNPKPCHKESRQCLNCLWEYITNYPRVATQTTNL